MVTPLSHLVSGPASVGRLKGAITSVGRMCRRVARLAWVNWRRSG